LNLAPDVGGGIVTTKEERADELDLKLDEAGEFLDACGKEQKPEC
jgi:hypothetical protein